MDKIESQKLDVIINVNNDIYGVVIKKEDVDDKNKLFFICKRKELENSSDVVMTYFTDPSSEKIVVWEKSAEYYERDILKTEKIEDDIELIIEEGEPRKITYRYLIPCNIKEKKI